MKDFFVRILGGKVIKSDNPWEWRCYMRDPNGYLIEAGQYAEIALDWFNNRS